MVAASSTTIPQEEASSMAQQMRVLGIDIATLVFHVVGMDDAGHVVLRKRLLAVNCCALSPRCRRSASAWKPVGVPMIGLDVSATMGMTCG
jgi:hypothetical protein